MSQPTEGLYELLPDFIRFRDQLDPHRGEPLKALMDVLQFQYDLLHNDIEGLYRNWFIETCDEWMVPYIGDLIGVRSLDPLQVGCRSRRALVANTLAYRRRKGTKVALTGVARDASGWPAYVRDLSRSLSRAQNLSRIRPGEGGTLDLRDAESLELLGTPFDRAAYSVDTTRRSLNRGETVGGSWRSPRPNLSNLGVYFWRLRPYPVERATPRALGTGRYTFDPFGRDVPLFNQPCGNGGLDGEVTEADLPAPLRAQPLQRELQDRAHGRRARTRYFGSQPVLQVRVGKSERTLELGEIEIRDLDWDLPNWDLETKPSLPGAVAAIDPARGRLAFFGKEPERVSVSYSYGFGGDVGGGPYERRDSLTTPERTDFVVLVDSHYQPSELGSVHGTGRPCLCSSVEDALAAVREAGASRVLVRIEDSATYRLPDLVSVELEPASQLRIEAADGQRPCLIGDFEVKATGTGDYRRFVLNGIWIEGSVEAEGRVRVDVRHCTLTRPAESLFSRGSSASRHQVVGDEAEPFTLEGIGGLSADGQPDRSPVLTARGKGIELLVYRSLVGPISMPDAEGGLRVEESVVDGRGGLAISGTRTGSGPIARILSSTVLGPATFAALRRADSALFTGRVVAARPREGRHRFCFMPPDSMSSRRSLDPGSQPATNYLAPTFVSTVPGDPGYAQPARNSPREILWGGKEGAEMGVFHHLCQNQRTSGLAQILNEYVPWGMETSLERAT